MTCKFCELSQEAKNGMIIYEDESSFAILSKKPASLCHAILFPKKHYTIIEQVPDEEIGKLFLLSNSISRAMFESLNIQGTNILIQNGTAAGQEEPHFSIHIIARVEKDDIKLEWATKKLSDDTMATMQLSYKQFTDGVVFTEEKKEKNSPVQEERPTDNQEEKKENYLLKYFNKMP